jgi:hypothetical protein
MYEIGYELSYRPHWVSTPLHAVNEMLATKAPAAPANATTKSTPPDAPNRPQKSGKRS